MLTLSTLGFSVSYTAEEKTQSLPSITFRRKRAVVDSAVLALEVASGPTLNVEVSNRAGDIWIGEFEAGPEGLTGIFATPCPDSLCVVNVGQGYLVPTLAPNRFQVIPTLPIKVVRRVPEASILLFVDYTRLSAVGVDGLLWETPRISWDGIRLVEVSRDRVRGIGWDSPANNEVEFSVDIQTGMAHGGSSPDHYTKIS